MTRCPICREPATQRFGLKLFCSLEHAAEWAKNAQIKSRSKKERETKQSQRQQRKSDRERLAKLKSNREWAYECQDVFNKMRRLQELVRFKELGQEPFCFSCQKPLGNDQWAAGHFYTRGARPDLAFEPLNVHIQHNVKCNMHLSGDIEGQKRGYFIRYGEKAQEILDSLVAVRPMVKKSPEEWIALKAEWNKEIRRLQKMLYE